MTKLTIEYSATESEWIDLNDLINKPEEFLILSLNSFILCDKCGRRYTIRKTKEYLSFLCGCGCRVIHPKDKNNVMNSTFISKEDYLRGKNGQNGHND